MAPLSFVFVGFLVLLCSGFSLSTRVLLDKAVRDDPTPADGQLGDGLEWFLLGTVPGGLGNGHDIVVKRLQPIRPPKEAVSESAQTNTQLPTPELDASGHEHGIAGVRVHPVPDAANCAMSKLTQTNAPPPIPEFDASGHEHGIAGVRVHPVQNAATNIAMSKLAQNAATNIAMSKLAQTNAPPPIPELDASGHQHGIAGRVHSVPDVANSAMSKLVQTNAPPPIPELDANGHQHGIAGVRVHPVPNVANTAMSKLAQTNAPPPIPELDAYGHQHGTEGIRGHPCTGRCK